MNALDNRSAALAAHLEVDADEIDEATGPDNTYKYGREEYLVLTDAEADAAVKEDIEQSLWAFVPTFLVDYLPDGVGVEVVEALQPQCERANDALRSMVGDRFDDLVEAAAATHGRGHFVARYDSEEHEVDQDGQTFYIYRVN